MMHGRVVSLPFLRSQFELSWIEKKNDCPHMSSENCWKFWERIGNWNFWDFSTKEFCYEFSVVLGRKVYISLFLFPPPYSEGARRTLWVKYQTFGSCWILNISMLALVAPFFFLDVGFRQVRCNIISLTRKWKWCIGRVMDCFHPD